MDSTTSGGQRKPPPPYAAPHGCPAAGEIIAAAKAHAAKGAKVVPLFSGYKHPYGFKDWHKTLATVDPNVIQGWPGIGKLTGLAKLNGPEEFHLDVDPRNFKGQDPLEKLEQRLGRFPHTWRVLTGGGGFHLIFRTPQGALIRGKKDLASTGYPGIEILGEGQSCVMPPSLCYSKGHVDPYAWADDRDAMEEPAEAPAALLALLADLDRPRKNQASNLRRAKPSQPSDRFRRWEDVLPDGVPQIPENGSAWTSAMRCPFYKEHKDEDKNPSFSISGDGGYGKCFAFEEHSGTFEKIYERLRGAAPPADSDNGADLPTILITPDMKQVVDAGLSALMKNGMGDFIFQRGGSLCRVTRQPPLKTKWLSRPARAPVIEPMPEAALRERLAEGARWLKVTQKGPVDALPPEWAVKALVARGFWPFPLLEGITAVPILRPDGTLWCERGYDRATGWWCDIDDDIARMSNGVNPKQPGAEAAKNALDVLREPFSNFPFKGSSDHSACLSSLLTIIARHLIPGPCPLFAIRAPTPGTGKTLLADVITLIATGRTATRIAPTANEEEDRKRIFTIALEGPPAALIDNVEHPLGSPTLAALLTGREIRDRLLGFNRSASAPATVVWMATGNNLVFRGDLPRRVVPIDLDAGMELPEERKDFRHPHLLGHVSEARPRLVAAAMTILRAWLRVPKEARPNLPCFGSFEEWSRTVREALVWLGEQDPCEGRQRIREEADPDLDALRALLTCWWEAFGERGVTAREVFTKAQSLAEGPQSRPDLLDALPASRKGENRSASTLGYYLRAHRDRIVGGLRLDRTGVEKGATTWSVRRVE